MSGHLGLEMSRHLSLEKVSESDHGEERFVVIYVEAEDRLGFQFTSSGKMTEHEARQLFRNSKRSRSDVNAMFRSARRTFNQKAEARETARSFDALS